MYYVNNKDKMITFRKMDMKEETEYKRKLQRVSHIWRTKARKGQPYLEMERSSD